MNLVKPRINLITVRLLLPNVEGVLFASPRQLFVVYMLYKCVPEAELLIEDSLKHLNFLTKLLGFNKGHPL
jgi:hypothetical protein